MPSRRDVRLSAKAAPPSPPGARHAVVVGINEYRDPRIQNLRYARADAEGLYDKLIDPELGRFTPENVVLLVDEQATERNIVSAIGTGLRRTAGEDDLVCIYYAGHGAIDPDPGAEDGLQKYIVPHDGDVDDLFSTAIPMTRVEEFFRRISARQVVFFLDSCYSGGANGRTFQNPRVHTRSVLSNTFIERLGARGRFVVTSCSPNEVSLESIELEGGHGVFTHYLLKGLAGAADRDGDGLVTMGELFDYLVDNVPAHSRRLGGSMTPIKTGSTEGRIYLTSYETEVQKAATKLEVRARELQESGALEEAEIVWRELSALVPGHEVATRALNDIANARERERQKREEAQRARAAEVQKKQSTLYRHFRAKELTADVFDEALVLLEREPVDLTGTECELRDLVDLLVTRRIQLPAFRTSWQLVKQEADREAGGVTGTERETAAREAAPTIAPEPEPKGRESAGARPAIDAVEPHASRPVTPETGEVLDEKAPDSAGTDALAPVAEVSEPVASTVSDERQTGGHDRPEGASPTSRSAPIPAEPWSRRGSRIIAFAVAAGLAIYLFSLLVVLVV